MLTFVEHPTFTKQAGDLFEDDEYHLFQMDLAARPDAGSVIPGLGGLRKIRWGAKGKREARGCADYISTHSKARYHLPVLRLYKRGH